MGMNGERAGGAREYWVAGILDNCVIVGFKRQGFRIGSRIELPVWIKGKAGKSSATMQGVRNNA